MTVTELKEVMEEFEENGFGDSEVRLLIQPEWPFEYSIGKIGFKLTPTEDKEYDCTDQDNYGDVEQEEYDSSIVYICEKKQLCYGPKFDEIGEV